MKKLFFPLVIILFAGTALAQQVNIDSLKRELQIAHEDTNKVNLLNDLSRGDTYSASDSGVMYAEKALELAEKINFKPGIILARINLAGSYTALGNFPQSVSYAFKALSLAEETHNNYLVIRSDAKLQECYYYYGEYSTALNYAFEALRLVKRDFPDDIYFPLADIAKDYAGMNQPDSALFYAKKAYQTNGIKGSIIEAYNLVTIGDAYTSKADYDSAIVYYRAGVLPALTYNIVLDLVDLYNGIAGVYKIKNDLDSAMWYSKKVLTEKNAKNYPLGLLRADNTMADIYQIQNKPDSSLKYLKDAIALKDSLFNREKTIAVQNLAFKEQEKQKNIEASRLKFQNRLKLISLLIGFAALLVIAIILLRSNRHKQRSYAILQKQKQEIDLQKTKTEHALAELKSTQSQLIQSEKMASLGELTAGIAHEIQNPLNFVNNFSEVNKEMVDEATEEIEKGNYDDVKIILNDIKENSEKINHHGKRADAIVKGMLEHSKASTGKKELTDINKLADEYLRLSYHGLRARDKSFYAEMKTYFDESLGKINIIPQDIGRVLLNLYNNAFYAVQQKQKELAKEVTPFQKVSPLYEPTVSVTTKKADNHLIITVSDNGSGIPQNIVDKVFQPFFTTKPTGSGTGLGLSLSYDIVKAHGGEIRVASKEGESTTFVIQLPLI